MATKKKITAKKAAKKTTAKKATVKKAAKKVAAKKVTAKKVVKKAAKKAAPKKSKIVAMPTTASYTAEDVALEAYFVFEERMQTGTPGDEASDWATAEARLSAKGKVFKTA